MFVHKNTFSIRLGGILGLTHEVSALAWAPDKGGSRSSVIQNKLSHVYNETARQPRQLSLVYNAFLPLILRRCRRRHQQSFLVLVAVLGLRVLNACVMQSM